MQHHVILISLDALRADRLGCYGYPHPISTNIDGLMRESLVFLNAVTPATWTLPAHMSMLSGLEPLVHGCVSSHLQYPPKTLPFPLIFELLESKGYSPQAVVGGGYVEPQFGFGRRVKDYRVIHPIKESIEVTIEHAKSWPLTFSLFHTYMVHDYPRVTTQFDPMRFLKERDPDYNGFFPTDEDFPALLRALSVTADIPTLRQRDIDYLDDLYKVAVFSADRSLRVLIRMLRDCKLWDNTTLIITSDHGESLGDEHNGRQHWFHGGPPYQEQLRVPLIIRPAACLRGLLEPRLIYDRVSLLDLVPTLLELVEKPYDEEMFNGTSLVDLCQGDVEAFEDRRLFCHSCEDERDLYLSPRCFGASMTWGEDGGKLLFNPRTRELREYYRCDDDPGEAEDRFSDLDDEQLREAKELIEAYTEELDYRTYHPPAEEFENDSIVARLAALGYVDA